MFDGYGGQGNGNSSCLFGRFDDGEGNTINGFYHDQIHHHVLGNNSGVCKFGKGNGKVDKKQGRRNFNDKYNYLMNLIPNETKVDRASIVLDANNHIHELKRTLGEHKFLVAKKRLMRQKIDQDNAPPGIDGVAAVVKADLDDFKVLASIQLQSSWIQKKCTDTEVDVRIVDDDVTIKLSQRKKINNCLLSASRTLNELRLDTHHVAVWPVGDYYSYNFNSKTCEASSVYASAVANKVIEVIKRPHAALLLLLVPPPLFSLLVIFLILITRLISD